MPIIRKALNNPCCDESMTQYRLNTDGTASVSTDGGATFHDLPENGSPLDPGTYFPPVTGDDVFAIRCKAANSVTGWYKLLYQQYADALATEVNEIALAAIFEGVLLLIGIGAFTIWAAVGTTLALLVAKKNHDDFVAEFSDAFWNKLCERAYCDVDAAGIYINTDPRQIIDEVTAAMPGYAADWLNKGMGTLNGRDLTNMAASGFDAGIDCSGFDCAACVEHFTHIAVGTDATTGHDEFGDYIQVTAVYSGDFGGYAVAIDTGDVDKCCTFDKFNSSYVGATGGSYLWSTCGHPIGVPGVVSYEVTSGFAPESTFTINCFARNSTTPFTAKLYFT